METIQIDIIDPKAVKLLRDLADMNLITIHDRPKNRFADVLKKLRSNADDAPSLEEKTNEVELVRKERYEKS